MASVRYEADDAVLDPAVGAAKSSAMRALMVRVELPTKCRTRRRRPAVGRLRQPRLGWLSVPPPVLPAIPAAYEQLVTRLSDSPSGRRTARSCRHCRGVGLAAARAIAEGRARPDAAHALDRAPVRRPQRLRPGARISRPASGTCARCSIASRSRWRWQPTMPAKPLCASSAACRRIARPTNTSRRCSRSRASRPPVDAGRPAAGGPLPSKHSEIGAAGGLRHAPVWYTPATGPA